MRVFITIFLGIFALVGFCVFFGLHSVLSYVDSPTAVTETAHEQALHELVLEAADAVLDNHFRPPPGPHTEELRAFVRTEARAVFKRVLSSDWFYEAVSISYAVVLAVLHDREDQQVIELADKKRQLLAELDNVAVEVGKHCDQFIGGPMCADEAGRRQAMLPVRRAIENAITQIPDRLQVHELAATAGQRGFRSDSPEMKRAREGFDTVNMIRWAGLGGLLLFMIFIGLLNRPLPRVLIASGAVLVVCSVIYLAGVSAIEEETQHAMAESMAERASQRLPAQARSVHGIAQRGTEKLVLGASHDSLHHADGTVYIITGLSLVSILGGIALARRQAG